MSDQATADPYAGIDLPKPPRGYRLAKWGEVYLGTKNKWGTPNPVRHSLRWWNGEWLRWRPHLERFDFRENEPVKSIFAVPKPRIRIELEQGEEVE